MLATWRLGVAAVGVLLLGTACSSSGKSSAGQRVPAGVTSAAGAITPPAGVTTPADGGTVPGGGAGDCPVSASQVSDIAGTPYDEAQAAAGSCTFVSADGAITIITSPSSGDEATTISALGQQYAGLEPIPGEDHAYASKTVGEVILFTDELTILVGSSNLDSAKGLALAKLVAG